MAIVVGIRRTRVVKIVPVALIPKRRNILVKVKDTGKPYSGGPKVTDQRKGAIAGVPWNAVKVKGSYVENIKKVKLTKAERTKLQKLTPDQRRARRRKLYTALDEKLASDNPADLKNIGRRVGEYSSKTGKKL